MRLTLLTEENILTGLSAGDFETALTALVRALPAWRVGPEAKNRILAQLVSRERLGTTATGGGTAFPHCFSADIAEPVMVFGVSPDGIPYPSLDGHPVHFVFMLILPEREGAESTKRSLLQNVRWVLCDRSVKERLRSAASARDVLAILAPHAQFSQA
ncbi:MAG TPA: PTS sugar transporter subunit IIA [Candidatus Omnitrophota bacterium]|jgi:PTS system nitrogen regulatory IIA component|nr:MAG: PTS system fructose-specific EIIABC component [Candidatus Omnitrophica bacterium ADurb.Bin314]HOE68099.1 PTS sugar transporter subunit IIA [Candidatus Omnitrophota bacterium]HQB94668.1 PTS sugar transporter subunit IIA [Candidatus Omnitrophota bacterium]